MSVRSKGSYKDTEDSRRGTMSLGLRQLWSCMPRLYPTTSPGLVRGWHRRVMQNGGTWNHSYPSSSAFVVGSWLFRSLGPTKPRSHPGLTALNSKPELDTTGPFKNSSCRNQYWAIYLLSPGHQKLANKLIQVGVRATWWIKAFKLSLAANLYKKYKEQVEEVQG